AGQFVIDLEPSALDKFARFAGATEAVRLELNQRGEGKSIVTGDEVHVAMSDTSHAECPLPAVIPCDIVQDRARVVPLRAVGHGARIAAHDEHGRVAQVVGAFARGHDYRGGHVRLLTAIEQSKWLYHPSRSLMVIDGNWRTMNRLGVEARVIAMRDGDF